MRVAGANGDPDGNQGKGGGIGNWLRLYARGDVEAVGEIGPKIRRDRQYQKI